MTPSGVCGWSNSRIDESPSDRWGPFSYLRERDLNTRRIYERGGECCQDDNFLVFKCPRCSRVYLANMEFEIVYSDPGDLSRRLLGSNDSFLCEECDQQFSIQWLWDVGRAVEGERHESPDVAEWMVTRAMLLQSAWAWCLAQSDED
jgi:hypothetical protein